jgi:hypothetical protein
LVSLQTPTGALPLSEFRSLETSLPRKPAYKKKKRKGDHAATTAGLDSPFHSPCGKRAVQNAIKEQNLFQA